MHTLSPQFTTDDSPKLLDQVRGILRAKHYSYKTEQSYIHWMKRYILFHNKRHPQEMGEKEISRFLTHLAVKENVAASTQNQALCALIFLYSQVLQKDVGDMFYKAAAYTLLKFGRDPKWLGAQLGLIGVLHTWGKGLCCHIHWHFIVPGGGLAEDGQWRNLPYNDKFIFPPKAMSRVIRARFIKRLRKAYHNGKIKMPDSEEPLHSPAMFEYFLNDLASDKWINYCKRPFGGPERALKYIGRYTHRVAISNKRLIDVNEGKIRFFVKDYKNGGATEQMTLPAEEFIRRFLMHILPRRFRKIRYAGFLAPAVRDEKLKPARQSLQESHSEKPYEIMNLHGVDLAIEPMERCPKCHIGRMQTIHIDRETMQRNRMLYMDSS